MLRRITLLLHKIKENSLNLLCWKLQSSKRSNNLQGFYNRSKNLIIIEQKEFELSLRGFNNAYN